MPDPDLTHRILQAVNDGFQDQLDFIAALTGFPSLRGQEATAQDFMAEAFRVRGYSVDRWRIDIDDIKDLPGFFAGDHLLRRCLERRRRPALAGPQGPFADPQRPYRRGADRSARPLEPPAPSSPMWPRAGCTVAAPAI